MPTEPTDDALRGFLLGSLPPDDAESVRRWLDADPAGAARLERLAARDSFTDAVSDSTVTNPAPADTVERVIRAVTDAVRSAPTELPNNSADDGTIQQTRPPIHFNPPPPAWPPPKLGQFRVIRELGHGGMGYVFEAEDEKLGRRVAVKVLTPELASRPDAAARFLREARAAAAVEHVNVVPILHVGEDAGVPYIVMPLLKGESLAERLKRDRRLPVAEAVRVGCDAAAGLGAAHAMGLVHRDMKPANVWIDAGTGRARVLDFGLARQGDGADAMTDSRALMGTPAYMAPEQLDGKPATPRSDIFSLGATLYECVTGEKAFGGPTITAILNAVNACRPKPPAELNPDVPPALSDVIQRTLRRNPLERPADAGEVIAALGGEERMPANPPGPNDDRTKTWVDSEPRPKQPGGRIAWLVGGGLTAAVVVTAVVWLTTRPSTPTVVEAPQPTPKTPEPVTRKKDEPSGPVRYRGKVDVTLARTKADPLVRLDVAGALPMRLSDTFRIEGEIDPPAYLYVVWVDPGHDVTPVYPWDAKQGWGSRPAKEEPVGRVSMPPEVGIRYRAPDAKPGVATIVMFARQTPLDVPDAEVEKWFKELPEVELPRGSDDAVVWFENFAEVKEPGRLRTRAFGTVEAEDPFTRWQGRLQKSLAGKVGFQSAVSFGRTGKQ